MLAALKRLRLRLVARAFHLLYNSFAWAYDFVSWSVSLGHWRRWTRAAIPRLRGTQILEIAFGTGNLLLDLVARGYAPFGLDLSPHMLRIAARKLRGAKAHLCQGRVQSLPFSEASFDSLVLTFPPGFLVQSSALTEMQRVLREGGRLVVVDAAVFERAGILGALINLAFRATGLGAAALDPVAQMRAVGFRAWRESERDEASLVQVFIGEKAAKDFITLQEKLAGKDLSGLYQQWVVGK